MTRSYGRQVAVELFADKGFGTHVSLSSDDDYSDELHVKEVFSDLVQQHKLKGIARKYSIVNVHYLLVQESGKLAKKYWLDLGHLSDEPRRRLIIAWKWLATAAVLTLITAAIYGLIPLLEFPYKTLILTGTLLCTAALAIISLYVFLDKTRYRELYFSRTGKAPLVEFMPGKPDRKQYRHFKETLQEHMLFARKKEPDRSKALARELREHRRLHEAQVISDKQYARARTAILQANS